MNKSITLSEKQLEQLRWIVKVAVADSNAAIYKAIQSDTPAMQDSELRESAINFNRDLLELEKQLKNGALSKISL